MEINNHGNNLVRLGVYIPHDLAHEPIRTNVWEKLNKKINELSININVIILGDFNASLHARKADEDQHIGNNILGKGLQLLYRKEAAAGNATLKRTFLINLLREHDMKCMNTFFQKPNKYKATFKLVAADKETESWTADRYAEIDFCLAHRRWANSINNVYTDPYTNVHTDRKSVIAKFKQKLKATETTKTERSFKGLHLMEDQENEFNQIIKTQLEEHDTDYNMNNFMKKKQQQPNKQYLITKHIIENRTDPEILRLINIRKEVVMRRNDDNTKEITKTIKKTARQIRTNKFVKGSKENKWDLIKNTKKGYTPKYTKMRNLDGNLVNDRESRNPSYIF